MQARRQANAGECRPSSRTPKRIVSKPRLKLCLPHTPTEAKRPAVLALHRELYQHIFALEQSYITNAERLQIREQNRCCERLWRTGELAANKPTVVDELDTVLHYLGGVLPAARHCVS